MSDYASWLRRQRLRHDPVGDLARDYIDDCRGKRVLPGRHFNRGYLEDAGACDGALDAFDRSLAEFRAEVGPKAGDAR